MILPGAVLQQEGKVGLRWRIEKEVVSGKGQFACGAKVSRVYMLLVYLALISDSCQCAGQNEQRVDWARPNCSSLLGCRAAMSTVAWLRSR